jgi:hypothetical protein
MTESTLNDETTEEARLNRGFITVFEQTQDSDKHDKGDRFLTLGRDDEWHTFNDQTGDFETLAVPIAYVELPAPIPEDSIEEHSGSGLWQLALAHFFDECEIDQVLTERGRERVSFGETEVEL